MRFFWRTLSTLQRRAARDLLWLGLAALVVCLVAFALNIPRLTHDAAVRLGAGNGQVGLVLAVLAAAAAIFGMRRWRDFARTEHDFRALFENSPIGVYRATLDGRFLIANAATARMLGYETPNELIARITDPAQQLYVNPQDRVDYLERLRRDGVVENFENQVYRRDGSRIWVLANSRAVRDAHGSILYIEESVQDITARKEMEAAYEQLSLESSQSIVILQEGRPVFVNSQFSVAMGYSIAELMAMTSKDLVLLIHPDDRQVVRSRARDVMEGRRAPSHMVFQVCRKDEKWRWVQAQVNRIEFHGKPALLTAVVDITERKLAQDEMQENVRRTQLRQEFGAALARSGNNLPDVLDHATRIVVGDLGDICFVSLFSEDHVWLEPTALMHVNPDRLAESSQTYRRLRLPSDHPLLYSLIAEGKPLVLSATLLSDVAENPFRSAVEYLSRYGIQSCLVVPLQHNGQVLGLLGVARASRDPGYTLEDQTLLQEIADRAAQAIANAQLVRQMQTELRARTLAEERYRTLTEQIPAITYVASPTHLGETSFVSAQIQEILGYAPEEWLSAPDFWQRHLHPDDRDWVLTQAHQARAAHSPFRAEYRLLTRDGQVRWVRDEARFVYDEERRALYQHGIMLDITTYKSLEHELTHLLSRANDAQAAASAHMSGSQMPDFDAARVALPAHSDSRAQPAREQEHGLSMTTAPEQTAFANALKDAAAFLNRASDIDLIWEGILETVARIVPYETATIYLHQDNRLNVVSASGFEARGLGEWIRTFRFPADLPKFRELTERAQPIVLSDTRTAALWIELPETNWIRSHIAAPLRIGDTTIGMLCLDSTVPGFYNAEHGARLMTFADLAAAALRHALLLRETKQRAQEFRALYETTADLSASVETAPLLETMVERAMQLTGAPIGFLFTYEAVPEHLRLAIDHGLDAPPETIQKLGHGLAGRVALMRAPLVIQDYATWEHRIALPGDRNIHAALAVPIAYRGNLIGVLGVAEKDAARQFESKALSLLTLFAGQAAAALETARLLSESRQRAEQLALLYDVGLTLNRVLDARTQLDFLFKIAQRALHADQVVFFVYEPQKDVLHLDESIGMPAELKEMLAARHFGVNPPEGLVGWVAQQRLPSLVPDVSESPHWVASQERVKSALAVPVEHENELRGVLLVASHNLNAFTVQDERMLILFANQVAAAIELTRLFQAQAGRQHELEILREASLAFASAPDHQELIELILQFALRLVTAQNVFLFFYHEDVLEFAGSKWSPESSVKPENFQPRQDGLTYTVARTGKMIVIDEVNTHPLFANWRWGGAIVGLPLKGGGQVRAVMNIAHAGPHRFTSEELRALELYGEQAAAALENARHYNETQRQLRDAQLLHRAGEALNRTLIFTTALEQLAEFFMQAVGVEACCISTVDVAADEVRVMVDRDPNPTTQLAAGTIEKLSALPYLVKLVNEQQTCTYHVTMPDLEPHLLETMSRYQWVSLLALPLFEGDRVIGVVELADHHQVRVFSPESVQLAESLAHQAASALQNARLFEQTRQRAEQLMVLNRIARRAGAATTLTAMLDIIEGEIAGIIPSDAFFIALYDNSTDIVEFVRVTDFGEQKPPFQWRLGPSLTRQVIASARALRMDDRQKYPSVDNPPQYYGDGIMLCAWLGVPIRFGDQVLGVISLQSKRRAAFDEAAEQLLQIVADQVAGAIARIPRIP